MRPRPDAPDLRGALFGLVIAMALFSAIESNGAESNAAPPVDPDQYDTFWTRASEAQAKATQSRVGILYYFPPAGTELKHPIFSEQAMNELSRRVVVVDVGDKCREKEALRKQYAVDAKQMVFVMTDYHGNVMDQYVARRGVDEKIDVAKRFEKSLKDADKWVKAMEAKLAKDYEKAKKNADKERYRKAIPELTEIAAYAGFDVAEKARRTLAEVVAAGKRELTKIERLEPEDAIKALRKLEKEFEGTEVEKTAAEARARLEKKPDADGARAADPEGLR